MNFFMTVASKTTKENARMCVESAIIPLESALGALNILLNKKEFREAMSDDEEIDIGLSRAKVEKIISLINEVSFDLSK